MTLADVAKELGISPDAARDWDDGKAQAHPNKSRSPSAGFIIEGQELGN
jgi:hypothetical protein